VCGTGRATDGHQISSLSFWAAGYYDQYLKQLPQELDVRSTLLKPEGPRACGESVRGNALRTAQCSR
jgi:hypothetical protein